MFKTLFITPRFHKGFIFLPVAFLLILFMLLYKNAPDKSESLSQTSFLNEQRQVLSNQINERGVQNAYQELKEKYRDPTGERPNSPTHLLAHSFGELLYQKVGVDGIYTCDDSFLHGCHHGFSGIAITDKGLDIVYELDQSCIKKYGLLKPSCQGGLGHGILSYLGHDNLEEALSVCANLNWKKPTGGCSAGVFSEYFFFSLNTHPTTISFKPRPLDKNNPYTPCPSLSDKYQRTCYYELPTWWELVYEHDYQTMATLCNNAPDQSQKEYCYMGLGHLLGPSTKYDVSKVVEICQNMPIKQGVLLCLAGGSRSFIPDPINNHLKDSVCNTISEQNDREYCFKMRNPLSHPNVI